MQEAIKSGYENPENSSKVEPIECVTRIISLEYDTMPNERDLEDYCARNGYHEYHVRTYTKGEKYSYNIFATSNWLERKIAPTRTVQPLERGSVDDFIQLLSIPRPNREQEGERVAEVSEDHTVVVFVRKTRKYVLCGAQYWDVYEYAVTHDGSKHSVLSADMTAYCNSHGRRWMVSDDAHMLPSCWDRRDMPYFRARERREMRDWIRLGKWREEDD